MSTEEDFFSHIQTRQAKWVGLMIIVSVFLACITFGVSTLIAPLGIQIDAGLPPGTLLGGSNGSAVTVLIIIGLLVLISLFCARLLFTEEFTLMSVIMTATLASVLTVGAAAGTIINPVTASNSEILSCVDQEFIPILADMSRDNQTMIGARSIHGDTVIMALSPNGVLSLADINGGEYHC